jgi:hypothetical protein
MGVKGLSSFVRACPATFSTRINLEGCSLTVDGLALLYYLIGLPQSPCLCLQLGGSYEALACKCWK